MGKKKGGQGKQQGDPGGPGAPQGQQQGGAGAAPGGSGPQDVQGPSRGPRGPQQPGGPDQPSIQQSQKPQGSVGHPPAAQQSAPAWGKKPEPPPQQPPAQQSAPAWGKNPEPPQQPPAQQSKPSTSVPGEALQKGKGKGKGKGQPLQQSAPTAMPAVSSTAPPVEEKKQPTPAEAKPGGKKQKGKSQESQKPAPPTTPSSSEVGDMVKKTENLTLFNLPQRKEKEVTHVQSRDSHVMKKFEIQVNYLPLKIKNPKLKIFHYDVNFNPDKPKYLLRKALEQIRLKHFSNRHPAFDGMKNMYLAGKPLNDKNVTIRDSVSVINPESGRDKEFDVTIKLVNSNLDIGQIFEYCKKGITSNIPQTEIQAMDIALRSGLTNHFTPAGRSFFARPPSQVILGGGMELWHGFYQSAVAAWEPYLNIDVANKAFPIQQPVLTFMCDELRCRNEDLQKGGLDQYQKMKLEKFIKGLKISYAMPNPGGQVQKRIYKVTGLGDTPIREKFKLKDDGKETTVGGYYQSEKKYTIKYPHLPLLKIGTKGSMVPIELCDIIGDQAVMRKLDENQTANMVRAAAQPTYVRKQRIDANILKANFANNPTLQEFGIEVKTSFEKVEAVVIKPPRIAYNSSEEEVRDGVWRLEPRDKFLTASVIPQWAVLNLNPRTPSNKVSELERLIFSVGKNLGMTVPPPDKSYNETRQRLLERDIDEHLIAFGKTGVKLVIVVLSNSNEIYGQVKRASELRTGVLTQCLKSRTLERINAMTVTNILLKVNAKLKGVNHSIAPAFKPNVLKVPCMLVGADVTHPAPGAESTPSIAAVAASHDINGFQYKMLYRLQPSREEMIIELTDIMKEQIECFIKRHNRAPMKIIYFRDGVSEGQFQQVLNIELNAIKRACLKINPDYKPAITFLVVQKRHHTRFFPEPKDGDRKNQNVPAGTLVDRKITHPTEVDFYLVSHQSIQGTARPTKYHLLYDDSNIAQVELEILTYYLCHMFSRCTRAVSYPAPTYYAHLAAFRARAWWDSLSPNMSQLRQEQESRGQISNNILDNYPMFFT